MTIGVIVEYFKGLAEKHKSLLHSLTEMHFCSSDDDSFESNKSKLHYPLMVMGPVVWDTDSVVTDNNTEVHSVSFVILDKVRVTDEAGKVAAYDKCKGIANDIISRMLYEAQELQGPMEQIEVDRTHVEPVGPMLDNAYGVVVDVYLTDGVDLRYDQDVWED